MYDLGALTVVCDFLSYPFQMLSSNSTRQENPNVSSLDDTESTSEVTQQLLTSRVDLADHESMPITLVVGKQRQGD